MDFSKHTDKFAVAVDGIAMGQVTNYWMERNTDAEAPPYLIKIRRRMAPTAERELFDFYINRESYKVAITRGGVQIIYYGCSVVSLIEEIADDRLIYETVTFSSSARSIADEDSGFDLVD